ncbi:MAG: lmo0937 family membrane protein [Bacteroidota bacterium]
MSKLLYIIAVILVIIWIIRVFFYAVSGLIHILIVLAIISFLIGIIRRS